MTDKLNALLELLTLSKSQENQFTGNSEQLYRHIYGGQFLGQALSAATQTVSSHLNVHSFHGYFLRRGDNRFTVKYNVEKIRDGKSFCTRQVSATQEGKEVFRLIASFQITEQGFDFQRAMPKVIGAASLTREPQLLTKLSQGMTMGYRSTSPDTDPFEFRPVPSSLSNDKKLLANRQVWIKANGMLPSTENIHQWLLAYISDYYFLPTMLEPQNISPEDRNLMMASVDHAMWFHRSFSIDQWLLFDIEHTSASNGRGIVKGYFYDEQGRLIASVVQEGLARMSSTR